MPFLRFSDWLIGSAADALFCAPLSAPPTPKADAQPDGDGGDQGESSRFGHGCGERTDRRVTAATTAAGNADSTIATSSERSRASFDAAPKKSFPGDFLAADRQNSRPTPNPLCGKSLRRRDPWQPPARGGVSGRTFRRRRKSKSGNSLRRFCTSKTYNC